MTRSSGFGQRLRQARVAARLTQQQLGDLLQTDQQYIYKLESGKIQRVSQEVILDAAEKLGVSPSWLALGIDELDAVSETGLQVGIGFDQVPVEIQNEILTLLLRHKQRPEKPPG